MKVPLSQPNGLGRNLDKLVFIDEDDAVFKSHDPRWGEHDVLVRAGSPHICQLLSFSGINHKVVVPAVLADDFSPLHGFPGAVEECAPFL